MDWLHWTLIFVGGVVTYGVIAYPFCKALGRHLRSCTTSDPQICRDKAYEFMGSACEHLDEHPERESTPIYRPEG